LDRSLTRNGQAVAAQKDLARSLTLAAQKDVVRSLRVAARPLY